LLDDYVAMVADLVQQFYSGVTRFTTGAFMHLKFGDALGRRGVAPHIYESRAEAEARLCDLAGAPDGAI
jgi:propionate CoA-transferase